MMPPITKMTVSSGAAYFSNAWIRLCPKNANASMQATTMTRLTYPFSPVSAASANAPDTEFTANQPTPATSQLMPAGRMLPR